MYISQQQVQETYRSSANQ